MKLEFRDLTEYFHHPPALGGLVGRIDDRRRGKKGEILLILPAYHEKSRLLRMLGELSRQSFKRFDVAIIYAKDDALVNYPKLPIIHVRRKTDLGFAGAIYAGQLLAIKEGYKYHLTTDVDKYPHSRDSIKILYNEAEKNSLDYVRGKFAFQGFHFGHDTLVDSGKTILPKWRFAAHWGLIRTSFLEKIGLYALPLYMGCDDPDFAFRICSSGARKKEIGAVIFSTYYPTTRLFSLILVGGFDKTYRYPLHFTIERMPEIFFTQFQTGSALGDIQSAFLVALPALFIANVSRRFLEARLSVFKEYGRAINSKKFMVPSVYGLGEGVKMQETGPAHLDGSQIHTSMGWKSLLAAAEHLANRQKSPVAYDFFMLLPERCTVIDFASGKSCRIEWKNRLGMPAKSFLLLQALLDTAYAAAKGMLNIALGKHLFKSYGAEQARKAA